MSVEEDLGKQAVEVIKRYLERSRKEPSLLMEHEIGRRLAYLLAESLIAKLNHKLIDKCTETLDTEEISKALEEGIKKGISTRVEVLTKRAVKEHERRLAEKISEAVRKRVEEIMKTL